MSTKIESTVTTETFQKTTTTTKTVTKIRSRRSSSTTSTSTPNLNTPFDISAARFKSTKVAPIKVSLDDLDELIGLLSPDEMEELGRVDPDDSSMPPSMRCIYNCDKSDTGELDRSAMLQSLQEKAVKTPDKEERVRFIPGTIRGKKFVPKDDEDDVETAVHISHDENDDEPFDPNDFDDEYIEYFERASMKDLQDLADILGVAYQDHCRATEFPVFPAEPPNDVDLNDLMTKLERDVDENLSAVNLNNVKGIDKKQWERLLEAVAKSNVVRNFYAANCDITDAIGSLFCRCVERNRSLKVITLDSNSLSGEMVVKLIQATATQQSVEELRVSNQLNCKYLGSRIEAEIADSLTKTPQLIKLGLTMEFRDTLNRTAVQLQKNLDKRRQNEDRAANSKKFQEEKRSIVEERLE